MPKQKTYRAVHGLDYEVAGEHRRVEPGETAEDLPSSSVPWLLDGGHIEEVEA